MSTIEKQYNAFSGEYSDNLETQDEIGNRRFYETLATVDIEGKKVLDVGCGDGSDMAKYKDMGAGEVSGIDPSDEFAASAKEKNPDSVVAVAKGEDLPFPDNSFDVVVSKYALQTSPDVPKVLQEITRVLKEGGQFVLLSKHPLRQFIEKIKTNADSPSDYYQQEIVDSFIYEGKIHLREPSHPMSEYLSPSVLEKLDLQSFVEDSDFPASEQIGGHTYPTFFVAKFERRKRK